MIFPFYLNLTAVFFKRKRWYMCIFAGESQHLDNNFCELPTVRPSGLENSILCRAEYK